MRSKASETRESAQVMVPRFSFGKRVDMNTRFIARRGDANAPPRKARKGGGSGVERSVSGRLARGREGEVAYQKVLKFSLKIGN